jgi:hypothetical protein
MSACKGPERRFSLAVRAQPIIGCGAVAAAIVRRPCSSDFVLTGLLFVRENAAGGAFLET